MPKNELSAKDVRFVYESFSDCVGKGEDAIWLDEVDYSLLSDKNYIEDIEEDTFEENYWQTYAETYDFFSEILGYDDEDMNRISHQIGVVSAIALIDKKAVEFVPIECKDDPGGSYRA